MSRTTRSRCKNKEAVLQCENKELEQYDKRLCLRVESVPSTDKETSEGVLGKSLFIDRAYRIGSGYKDINPNTFFPTSNNFLL